MKRKGKILAKTEPPGRGLEDVMRAAVKYFIREGDGLAAKVFTRKLVRLVEGRNVDGD